jgi:hypothetical protein
VERRAAMSEQGTDRDWHGLTEEVLSELAEWRVQHARATFAEIEREVDVRLARLRARMIQDMALRSARAEVGVPSGEERPGCPRCGTALEGRGKKTRALTTRQNQVVRLERSYAVCPACGGGLFPPG